MLFRGEICSTCDGTQLIVRAVRFPAGTFGNVRQSTGTRAQGSAARTLSLGERTSPWGLPDATQRLKPPCIGAVHK